MTDRLAEIKLRPTSAWGHNFNADERWLIAEVESLRTQIQNTRIEINRIYNKHEGDLKRLALALTESNQDLSSRRKEIDQLKAEIVKHCQDSWAPISEGLEQAAKLCDEAAEAKRRVLSTLTLEMQECAKIRIEEDEFAATAIRAHIAKAQQ